MFAYKYARTLCTRCTVSRNIERDRQQDVRIEPSFLPFLYMCALYLCSCLGIGVCNVSSKEAVV